MTGCKDLSSAWWLYLPLLSVAVIVTIIVFFPGSVKTLIESENGLVELGTPLLLLPAIIIGIRASLKTGHLPARWLNAWLLLVSLACVYMAGEEISWGQHLFGWQTPESFQTLNDQKETNIHNISSWFDQKPRLLLELWILVGGILIPLRNRFTGITWHDSGWQYWFWPTPIVVLTAFIAILVKLPERLENFLGWWPYDFHVRYSEVQEFYFALFLMLYVLSFSKRLHAQELRTE